MPKTETIAIDKARLEEFFLSFAAVIEENGGRGLQSVALIDSTTAIILMGKLIGTMSAMKMAASIIRKVMALNYVEREEVNLSGIKEEFYKRLTEPLEESQEEDSSTDPY